MSTDAEVPPEGDPLADLRDYLDRLAAQMTEDWMPPGYYLHFDYRPLWNTGDAT